MPLRELWRTTTFRLTVFFGLVFAVGTIALLGMVYLQSAVYMTRRVDRIMNAQADALARFQPQLLAERIDDALAVNADQTVVFALFTPDGRWIAGNLHAIPVGLQPGGLPVEALPTPAFHAHARLIARRLPSAAELVVGRDVNQLREVRAIIASALVVSGVVIILAMLACAVALSLPPIRRLRALQAAGEAIARGELRRRMPVSGRRDELDMFAATVNYMMDEVERLLAEVKGSTDTIAHDLRTPLTRARAHLHRLRAADAKDRAEIDQIVAEIDEVLERFRALMRLSELEARDRQSGFSPIDLVDIVEQALELYQPLAEAEGITLSMGGAWPATVEADPKLLFEAISNLVDNAIKFSRPGGAVQLGLAGDAAHPQVVVRDNGPGIAPGDRPAVLRRFYRSERDKLQPGAGLGLSIVAAIVRLHRFEFEMQDADPGVRAVIDCWRHGLAY